jgi:hypothetical protein
MRVYFTASLRGKKDFGLNYEEVVGALIGLGHKVYSEHILKMDFREVRKQDKLEAQRNYHQLITEIKKAELFVAEVSTQSLSVGHEITEAIVLNKPVILLYTGDTRPNLLFGSGYGKLQLVQYLKTEDLKEILERAIEIAKQQSDVRFNFFVSPKILNYLDWIAQKRMIPRSVFLRNLIEREMKKDKEFKE